MRYFSTRNSSLTVSGTEAIIRGLAEDGGLFVPETIPAPDFKLLRNATYQEAAECILSLFFDELSRDEIHACVQEAYNDRFSDPDIVPLKACGRDHLIELFRGPTCAFKDIALSVLPGLLSTAYRKSGSTDTVAILTATSGDTGKAALAGFADVPHTAIKVYYPENGVSPVQKLQMQTSRGNNVYVRAVQGNFDDCQRLVKRAYRDAAETAAKEHVILSSANSINIGRLVPQIVYYITSYYRLVREGVISDGEEILFAVPTGNFGDILAGYLAKRMGLPVKRLICASNRNRVLTDFLETGTYSRVRPFHETMSPSMDILVSSNLERLLYLITGDDAFTAACMRSLEETGSYTVPPAVLDNIRAVFTGTCTEEENCADVIRNCWQEHGVLIDPHTAVAVYGLEQYRKMSGDDAQAVVLSTASPFKFAHDVLRCLSGEETDDFTAMDRLSEMCGLPVPQSLAELHELPVRFTGSIRASEGMDDVTDFLREVSAHV